MATTFATKTAITRLVWAGLLNDVGQILARPAPVAMTTKFKTKSAITRLV